MLYYTTGGLGLLPLLAGRGPRGLLITMIIHVMIIVLYTYIYIYMYIYIYV